MVTQESIQPFLDWIRVHPSSAMLAVFFISLSESLAIIGLLVPGVVLMTAIGSMMGAGILPFYQTLLWAILGAIAGDGISYWLGYHYHQRLRHFWPFRQFPRLLARGEAFFSNHGGKSIVFGRFVGPVRPMIPVIAGMMDMTPKRFLFFNILSAIVWAPLYSLPGILIGMSLGNLSAEVASRAGLLVLLLLLVLW
ncbi:MAG: DedA family protein, partial [Gammaproteobacteria bacterium]|nr:DedA family protein [Gammaproteobacteria bacterium]